MFTNLDGPVDDPRTSTFLGVDLHLAAIHYPYIEPSSCLAKLAFSR